MALGPGYGTFLYKYYEGKLYTYVTPALLSGSHAIQITALDEFENESDLISGNASVDTYLRPASRFTGTLVANKITLTWTVSKDDADGDFDKYNIYWNSGSGDIDTDTPLIQLAAGVATYTTAALGNGDYKFLIRVQKVGGLIEQNWDQYFRQKIPDVPEQPGLPGSNDDETQLFVTAETSGKARIQFIYPYKNCDHFNIYWRETGESSWGAVKETFTPSNNIVQEHLTGVITYEESKSYDFMVRAANASDEEDGNNDIVACVLDGKKPQKAQSITLTVVNGDEGSSVS